MRKIYLFLHLISIALYSCSDENIVANKISDTEIIKIIAISSSLLDNVSKEKSRLAYHEDEQNKKLTFKWTQGDKISLFPSKENAESISMVLSSDSYGSTIGTFTGEGKMLEAGKEFVLVYPENKNSTPDNLFYSVAVQKQTGNQLDISSSIMTASGIFSQGDMTVNFHHKLALAKFILNLPSGFVGTPEKLLLSSPDIIVDGYLDITQNKGGWSNVQKGGTQEIDLENVEIKDNKIELWAMFIPTTIGNIDITIQSRLADNTVKFYDIHKDFQQVIEENNAYEFECRGEMVEKTLTTYFLPTRSTPVSSDRYGVAGMPAWRGEVKLSEHYDVYVRVDGEPERKLDVMQSDPIGYNFTNSKYDNRWSVTSKRSFSFVNVSYNESTGKQLSFRVISKDGYTNLLLKPDRYNLSANGKGSEAEFVVNKANRYIIANFDCNANKLSYSSEYDCVKNMLCIFIDPQETEIPNPTKEKVAYFSDDISESELKNAKTIYFRRGFNAIRNCNNGNGIGNMANASTGVFTINPRQNVYIEGGAFLEAAINRDTSINVNKYEYSKIYGRGTISGRKIRWKEFDVAALLACGKKATCEGFNIMESPNHGIVVGDNSIIQNVKFMGWHCNNDGMRPGTYSKVSNCFLRPYDDAFYNYHLTVNDCVIWQGFNGSIMTFGWNHINICGSTVERIDIVYPEWTGMGNNAGLIMSQNDCAFSPTMNGVSYLTTFRDIHIDGKIPGFVNLKPNSDYKTVGAPLPLANISQVGWLGNVLLENITIKEHSTKTKSLIQGLKGTKVVKDNPDAIWYVKDVTMKNITIGNVKLSSSNILNFFNIDSETTQNINVE